MLLHESHHLHTDRVEQLARVARDGRPKHTIRVAVARALAGLAHRLAPEVPEVPVLRTRAAPN
jgi:hypothetical protein